MDKAYPRIAVDPMIGTYVEMVDELGFVGLDPTGSQIMQAYESHTGRKPITDEEYIQYGDLVLRTAQYQQEIFNAAVSEITEFGSSTEEYIAVAHALSLSEHDVEQIFPLLSKLRATHI